MTTAEHGGSPLLRLGQRRKEIKSSQVLPLQVPRWENPEIWVEYEPVDYKTIRAGQMAVEKAKKGKIEAELNMNADLLIKHCIRVFAILDGKEYSLDPEAPEGEFTIFDEALGRNLGLYDGEEEEGFTAPTARQVCRELFITDGDLTDHAVRLTRWSGLRNAEADEEFQGE